MSNASSATNDRTITGTHLKAIGAKRANNTPTGGLYTDKIITGTVISSTESQVVVDIGLQSMGFVRFEETASFNNPLVARPGEQLEVTIDSELPDGGYSVSFETARRLRVFEALEKAEPETSTLRGVVVTCLESGLTVDIGTLAFLPWSEMPAESAGSLTDLVGQCLDIQVVAYSRQKDQIVVSRKAVAVEEGNAETLLSRDNICIGDVIKGVVEDVSENCVSVVLDGVLGSVHVYGTGWKELPCQQGGLRPGDSAELRITRIKRDRKRCALAITKVTRDPWLETVKHYRVGSRIRGRVLSATRTEIFVQLGQELKGVTGWDCNKIPLLSTSLTGREIETVVAGVDRTKHLVLLRSDRLIRSLLKDIALDRYPVGSIIEGRVVSVTQKSILAQLEPGILGEVRLSDARWGAGITRRSDVVRKGDTIKAVVVSEQARGGSLSLEMKQLHRPGWKEFAAGHQVGEIVRGVALRSERSRISVRIGNGVEGFCTPSKSDRGKIAFGKECKFRITRLNLAECSVGLAFHAVVGGDPERKVKPEDSMEAGANADLANLARESMRSLKAMYDLAEKVRDFGLPARCPYPFEQVIQSLTKVEASDAIKWMEQCTERIRRHLSSHLQNSPQNFRNKRFRLLQTGIRARELKGFDLQISALEKTLLPLGRQIADWNTCLRAYSKTSAAYERVRHRTRKHNDWGL